MVTFILPFVIQKLTTRLEDDQKTNIVNKINI